MTATTIRVQMAQRKDTAANWTSANPILLSGEIGYETDTKKFKIGNGSTNWNSLAYLPIPDGSGNLTITGNLEIGSTGSLTFEGSTADGFETTLAVTNPTGDRTITLPDRSGTVITSGDTGTVTSTMLADGTIVNDDVNVAAAIAGTKISPDFGSQTVQTTGIFSHALGSAAAPTVTFTGDTNTGIYSPGADQVAISTGGSGRLFVDSSGRLLVGTSSSASAGDSQYSKLQIRGNTSGSPELGIVSIQRDESASTIITNEGIGEFVFTDNAGNTFAAVVCEADSNAGAGDYPGRLVFSTTADGASSPTERMRIINTGQVFVNQTGNISGTGNACLVQVTGNEADFATAIANSNASPYGVFIRHDTDINNSTNIFLLCNGASSQRAAIRADGGLANFQANDVNLSDINTKKDISPAAGTWDCIKEWEIVNYRYKDQPDDADVNLGVIAQQVAESCPEVVTVFEEAKDDQPEKLGVKEQQMYWMAIKALQEAQVRIETLEAKVAVLEGA